MVSSLERLGNWRAQWLLPMIEPTTAPLTEQFPLLDHVPQGICLLRSDWSIVYWNTCLEEWTGLHKEEMLGRPIGQSFPHLMTPKYLSGLEPLFSGGAPVTFPPQFHAQFIPCSLLDGRPRIQHTIAKAVPVEDGSHDYYVMLVIGDVTPLQRQASESQWLYRESLKEIAARKETEHSLRSTEKQLRLILDAVPSGMVMINDAGMIVLANELMICQFGYVCDELLGHTFEMLIPERFRTQYLANRANFSSPLGSQAMSVKRELCGLRKDGSEFPVEIGLNALTVDERTFTLASIIDITARKREEATLYQYMDDLHRSNQELDDFAYIASHDLKEPLRGIFNYSTILLEDFGSTLNEEGRSRCETLLRLSKRMESLIDSLLYFSRVGRTDMAMGPTELQPILDEILDSLDIRLKECGVTIRIPRPLPTVVCDRVRVREIFCNLMTNAMKYNDKPEKWIEVGYVAADGQDREALGVKREAQETREDDTSPDTPHGILVFYVRDNGIGIKEKNLDSVFRIFKRLHGRDKFGGGTGAGLTITKKIVERHDGKLWVESSYGEGTTFFFTLAKEEM